MKDKQQMRFHVVPRADIPDLFGEGTAVRIGRKYVEKPRVEMWTVQPSIETENPEEMHPVKKKKKPMRARTKKAIRRWVIVGVLTAAVAVSYLTITLQT